MINNIALINSTSINFQPSEQQNFKYVIIDKINILINYDDEPKRTLIDLSNKLYDKLMNQIININIAKVIIIKTTKIMI